MSPPSNARPAGRALLPAAGLPLAYFAFAHLCLALACVALVFDPSLPGGFYLHPRMVALVHLVTLGWISGSILGAFYIVGPLALRMPLRPGWIDRAAFATFVLGVAGVAAAAWTGNYSGMAWAAALVLAAILELAVRAWAGLRGAVAPWPVKLHVALAFANILAAGLFGMIIGMERAAGRASWSPVSAAYAHAHLAAIGWAVMMVVGLSYRLIPMILPAAMPTGGSMAASAVLVEAGVIVLAIALLNGSGWTAVGALLVIAGLVSFSTRVHTIVRHRLPPPAALPRPDWATRQTHVAFVCLLTSAVLGVWLALPFGGGTAVGTAWVYGVLGLIGFLSQIVVGIQGRLLPLHGWYRAFEAGGLTPPDRSAHVLASHALSRWIFLAWTVGVPLLALSLPLESRGGIAAAGVLLTAGVLLNAAQAVTIVKAASAASGRSRR